MQRCGTPMYTDHRSSQRCSPINCSSFQGPTPVCMQHRHTVPISIPAHNTLLQGSALPNSFIYRVHSRCQQPTSNPLPSSPLLTLLTTDEQLVPAAASSCSPKIVFCPPFPSSARCSALPALSAPRRRVLSGGRRTVAPRPPSGRHPAPAAPPLTSPRCPRSRGSPPSSPRSKCCSRAGNGTSTLLTPSRRNGSYPLLGAQASPPGPCSVPGGGLLPPSPASSESRAEREGQEAAGRSPPSSPALWLARDAKHLLPCDIFMTCPCAAFWCSSRTHDTGCQAPHSSPLLHIAASAVHLMSYFEQL